MNLLSRFALARSAGALLANNRPTAVSASDGYARWAPVYPPRAHNPLMEAERSIVAPLFVSVRARRALDVGTGTGRNLLLLQEAGVRSVVGIDLSAAMLSCGNGHFPRVRGDACVLPFRRCAFDLVSSSLMCGDLADLRPWIAEAARVLVRGGHLVYSDFHPAWAAARWRRTFTGADGRRYELPVHHHAIDDHLALIAGAGLEIRAIREPKIPGGAAPVVAVFHAVKGPAEPS
jgi:malonyl-CoA O-methyltransferase